jgi:hypothetical protein
MSFVLMCYSNALSRTTRRCCGQCAGHTCFVQPLRRTAEDAGRVIVRPCRFCEEHNLPCTLLRGTVRGTVRLSASGRTLIRTGPGRTHTRRRTATTLSGPTRPAAVEHAPAQPRAALQPAEAMINTRAIPLSSSTSAGATKAATPVKGDRPRPAPRIPAASDSASAFPQVAYSGHGDIDDSAASSCHSSPSSCPSSPSSDAEADTELPLEAPAPTRTWASRVGNRARAEDFFGDGAGPATSADEDGYWHSRF